MVKANQFKLFAVVTATVLCLLVLVAVQPADAAFPGKNGRIAFQSDRDVASGEIYTIIPGGTATRITNSNGSADPAYSPDGSRIAFVSAKPGGTYQIFVMNADGSGRRQITKTSTAKQDPTWSPDGSKIAYVASSFDVDGQTDLEIWTINADGSGRRQLTKNSFPDTQPAWSPLGDKIAFVSTRTGDTNRNIYIMNSNGSGQTSITPNSPPGCSSNCYQGHDDDPAWSPDGSKIAYVHGYGPPDNPFAGGGKPNIWTMNPNGSGKTNVSNDPDTSASLPAWSPNNGTQIAYVRNDNDIWKMNAGGGGHVPVETNSARDINPDWQPIPVCTRRVNANNDPLTGTVGKDVLCGDNRNNTINGKGGNDIILANGGNDRLTGELGNDTMNGGPGTDTVLYSGSTRVIANLTTGFATGVGSDILLDIENLTGSNANDILKGSSANNSLVGGGGADKMYGLGRNDRLDGRDGAATDTLNGGPGTDRCLKDAGDSVTACE